MTAFAIELFKNGTSETALMLKNARSAKRRHEVIAAIRLHPEAALTAIAKGGNYGLNPQDKLNALELVAESIGNETVVKELVNQHIPKEEIIRIIETSGASLPSFQAS